MIPKQEIMALAAELQLQANVVEKDYALGWFLAGIAAHEVFATEGRRQLVLLNNLSSFATQAERAGEFGDIVLAAKVPTAKVLFHCHLLPRVLQGECEYLVLGGLYSVERSSA